MKTIITEFSRIAGEIERRNTFRVGSIYLITAATLSALAADLFPAFGISDLTVRITVTALFVGLPFALILAWIFELTPEGIQVDAGSALEQDTIALFSEQDAQLNVVIKKEGRRETIGFNNGFTIGRSHDADIHVDDPSVSRQHARVFFCDGSWVLEDLNSRNGTKLNGRRVSKSQLPALAEVNLPGDGPVLTIRTIEPALDRTRLVAVPPVHSHTKAPVACRNL